MVTGSAVDKGRKLGCPKCKQLLRVALDEDVQVDVCNSCGGVWVDVVEEREALRMKPQVFTIDDLRRLRRFYEGLGRTDPVRYVPCPICGELMNRKIWGSHSGVLVDKCFDHGTWFDANELEKVREYVEKGGIEWEKLQAAEQGLRDVHNKLTGEINRLDRRIDSTYRKARLWSLMGF